MADNESNQPEPLMTAEEVAAYLKVSEGTVGQWVKAGRIPVVKVGSLNRFRRADIEGWVNDNARTPEPTKAAV